MAASRAGLFKPGATDGRNTQVLAVGPIATAARHRSWRRTNDQQAFERKLEPGMAVDRRRGGGEVTGNADPPT